MTHSPDLTNNLCEEPGPRHKVKIINFPAWKSPKTVKVNGVSSRIALIFSRIS